MQIFLEISVALAWALWLGSMVFFSFVVAPTVFRTLGREDASPVIRALFPGYYLFGIVNGAVAASRCLLFGADLRMTVPLVAALVMVAYARQRILPAVDAARAAEDEAQFERLHRLSVRLNMVVMALLLLAGSLIAL